LISIIFFHEIFFIKNFHISLMLSICQMEWLYCCRCCKNLEYQFWFLYYKN
jgi:hypothetical protein